MSIVKITIEQEDGSTYYLIDKVDLVKAMKSFPKGLSWHKTATIEVLQHKYFAMLTELAKNTNSGNSKTDLHNSLKPMLLTNIKEFTHYYRGNKITESTKDLNAEGWSAIIEQLRVVANDIFNYTFIKQIMKILIDGLKRICKENAASLNPAERKIYKRGVDFALKLSGKVMKSMQETINDKKEENKKLKQDVIKFINEYEKI